MNDPKVGEVWLADLYGDGDIFMFGRVTGRQNEQVWAVWYKTATLERVGINDSPSWTPVERCIVQVMTP